MNHEDYIMGMFEVRDGTYCVGDRLNKRCNESYLSPVRYRKTTVSINDAVYCCVKHIEEAKQLLRDAFDE